MLHPTLGTMTCACNSATLHCQPSNAERKANRGGAN